MIGYYRAVKRSDVGLLSTGKIQETRNAEELSRLRKDMHGTTEHSYRCENTQTPQPTKHFVTLYLFIGSWQAASKGTPMILTHWYLLLCNPLPGLFWAANRIGQKWSHVSFKTGHKKTSLGTVWHFYFLESFALGWPGAHLKDGQGSLAGGPNGEERSAPLPAPMSELPVGPRTTQLSGTQIPDHMYREIISVCCFNH